MLPQQLIEKFFKNECSDEERLAVFTYLETHPETLHNYLKDEDWHNFVPNENLPEAISKKLFKAIRFKIYKKQLIVKRIGYSLAAASVIVMAIVGLKLFYTGTKKESVFAQNKAIITKQKQLAVRVNTTDHNMQILLDDGSIVELSPKSSVLFNTPFVKDNKRTIYLTGEAYFKVAKDKTKPFTVFSGDIATTALGTSFTIKAFEADNYIKVHLHTGKVVVKSADQLHKKLDKELYLLPDNILLYDKLKMLASINQLDSKNNLVKLDNTAGNNYRVPNWFMFNNQSLSQVLDQLEEIYDVNIFYAGKDVSSMYVIGKFDKTDSVENILKTIAKLNGLTVKKQHSSYIITK